MYSRTRSHTHAPTLASTRKTGSGAHAMAARYSNTRVDVGSNATNTDANGERTTKTVPHGDNKNSARADFGNTSTSAAAEEDDDDANAD